MLDSRELSPPPLPLQESNQALKQVDQLSWLKAEMVDGLEPGTWTGDKLRKCLERGLDER